MSTKILTHFKKNDPVLYQALVRVYEEQGKKIFELTQSRNLFETLCESIVSQQLSVKAGDTIYNRVLDLMPERKLNSKNILWLQDEQLRQAGLSWAKVGYIKDLAMKVETEQLNLEKLIDLPEDEAIAELIKIKGVGRWTAEMFLMFALGREDIFSHGDIGLQNAIKKLYKFDKYDPKVVDQIVIKWRPYRTFAARILWRSLNFK